MKLAPPPARPGAAGGPAPRTAHATAMRRTHILQRTAGKMFHQVIK